MWNKKKQFPNMRNIPKPSREKGSRVRKVGNRYSLASPQLPSTEVAHNTSTPVPARSSHSILSHTSSPIRINPNNDRTPISYSPPEEFQSPLSPILHSPIITKNNIQAKKKKRSKLAKVKIYHPKKTDKRKTAKKRAVAVGKVVSTEDVSDEAPLPKRIRIRENANKRGGRETDERTPGQFPCKSVKVVGGSIIDLRVGSLYYLSCYFLVICVES